MLYFLLCLILMFGNTQGIEIMKSQSSPLEQDGFKILQRLLDEIDGRNPLITFMGNVNKIFFEEDSTKLVPKVISEGSTHRLRGFSQSHHKLGDFSIIVAYLDDKTTLKDVELFSRSFDDRIVLALDIHGFHNKNLKTLSTRSKIILINSPRILTKICQGRMKIQSEMIERMSNSFRDWFNSCPNEMEGKQPTITTVGKNPFVMSKSVKNEAGEEVTKLLRDENGNPLGVDNDLTSLICARFKAKGFKLIPTNNFDIYDKDQDQWLGRVGEILSEKADFGVGFPPVGLKALKKVDVTNWIHVNEVGFASGHPKPQISLLSIVRPFSLSLWILIISALISTILVFQLTYHIHQTKIKKFPMKAFGVWDIPLQTLETMVEFRMMNFFANDVQSAKTLRGFFIVFTSFIVMAYSSMLRSALVAKDMTVPLDDIKQVAEQELPFYMPFGSPIEEFVRVRNGTYPFDVLYKNKVSYQFNFGFIRNSSARYETSYAYAETYVTNLFKYFPWTESGGYYKDYFAKNRIYFLYTYVLMGKGSSIKEDMTYFISTVRDMGFMDQFLQMKLPVEALDWKESSGIQNDLVPLTIQSVALAFFIAIGGMIMATAIFITEKFGPRNKWIAPT